jgi:two-component system sensor histidine kinase ArlS
LTNQLINQLTNQSPMTKKLLYKTSRTYLLLLVIVLIVAAPAFYIVTKKLYLHETDEALILRKDEFLKYSLHNLTEKDISTWNNFNRDIKIEAKKIDEQIIFNTFYYDTLVFENEPYRELNAPILIENQPYTFAAKINLVETEDLILNIAVLFFILFSLVLMGLYFITQRLSANLWQPFYDTLKQIENFEIDKLKQPNFPETNIEEFNRLNKSIEKLMLKNTSIYLTQREFIENAAHELQTPLAVFQAKIDTLIQREDVTEEQAQILGDLNNNVGRLNRLNKNLLLLSKLDNDNFGVKNEVVLNDIFNTNLDFFEEQAEAKNITISINENAKIKINSKPILIEILLNNLFLNAIRHNVVNGQIRIEITAQSLLFSNTGQDKPLNSEKLFNRFSKLNPSEKGTGLGLAIIKKIADLNGWKMDYTYQNELHVFTVLF